MSIVAIILLSTEYTIIIPRSADEKLKVPNPTYADLIIKSDDINMESNPAYQCSSGKQDDVKDHHYETINSDDKVVKSVANKSNTVSD